MDQHEDIYQEQPDNLEAGPQAEKWDNSNAQKEAEKQSFWDNVKAKSKIAGGKIKEGAHWCSEHAGELVVMGFLGAGLLVKGMTEYNKMADRNDRHKNVKPSRIYDYRGHAWIDLKRPMSNREKEEFNARYYDGHEDPYEVLRDMRLLK